MRTMWTSTAALVLVLTVGISSAAAAQDGDKGEGPKRPKSCTSPLTRVAATRAAAATRIVSFAAPVLPAAPAP
jgi:hypothetical protein